MFHPDKGRGVPFRFCFVLSQPSTRSPQKVTRQGEPGYGDREEEIIVRTKQEVAKPSSQKKSLVPSTVSRKVKEIWPHRVCVMRDAFGL